MSVELVTGYSGVGGDGEPNRHVSSAEDGARQAGTVGLGCYALSTGSRLSATMEDANTLIVADGDVIMYGRHVSLPDPTSFTIPTGVQGQKVSNLAVLRYEKAADSVESVTPVVLTGEPSADAPTDPAHNDGSILDGDSPVDMPLYRVVTDGVNAGTPEPLFDILMPLADLRDSVSPTRFTPTPNTALNNYLDYATHCFRSGDVIFLHFSVSFSPSRQMTGDDLLFFTLPEGYRPTSSVSLLRMVQILTVDGGVFYRSATVASNGRVTINDTGVDDVDRLLISVAVDASTWGI